ncbi:hypothetical protein CS063_16970 [Sporanaerobium hydrogeniformans]|uniref:Uncharacterized protein n=1 Tax=Sporanaerobium hydrogeniformans TaxID=3072179 RepID=A0AC61D948_9FIRM|nr:recombinase family protein [Sporanaerobium hydrogeniformans]PHV69233.1 hypothetical protein CS063_16970 [Sporanaerobium hydrogeniformans]
MNAAAYTRYSTDNQTENSITYQLNAIQKYCSENNITLTAFYSDEAYSGTNTNRPGFLNMIAAAKRHEFDAVVIYDISRGSRDVGDWFDFRKQMMLLNIAVISANQQLGDITDPNNFLVELINVGLGQHQVLDTRKKSLAGVAERAKKGAFLGGVPPLGYDIVNGEYTINPGEASIVRKIFTMYAKGDSYNDILQALNGYKGKRGKVMCRNSLNVILQNDRYIGTYTWNKKNYKLFRKWTGGIDNPNAIRIDDFIPPLIDRTIWERVQSRMKNNKSRASNKAKREYLLSGLIECEACGSTYVGHTSTNSRGYESRYYCCGDKYRTRNCKTKNIKADIIETFVVQSLKSYLKETNVEELAQYIADQVNNASPNLVEEKKELNEITTKIHNGVKAVLAGASFPELEEEIARLRIRKSELEDIILRQSSSQAKVSKEALVNLFKSSLDNWDTDLKNIIKTHVTKIYAHTDGTFTVNVGVHYDNSGRGI